MAYFKGLCHKSTNNVISKMSRVPCVNETIRLHGLMLVQACKSKMASKIALKLNEGKNN